MEAKTQPIRANILDEAKNITLGSRQDTYGSFVDNMEHFARLLNTQFDTNLSAHDACIVMALTKISRIKCGKPHRDNYVDAVNYIAAAWECHEATGVERPHAAP